MWWNKSSKPFLSLARSGGIDGKVVCVCETEREEDSPSSLHIDSSFNSGPLFSASLITLLFFPPTNLCSVPVHAALCNTSLWDFGPRWTQSQWLWKVKALGLFLCPLGARWIQTSQWLYQAGPSRDGSRGCVVTEGRSAVVGKGDNWSSDSVTL